MTGAERGDEDASSGVAEMDAFGSSAVVGSMAMLIDKAAAYTRSSQRFVAPVNSRSPLTSPAGSTRKTLARRSTGSGAMTTTMVRSADGKNGSYPSRVLTALRNVPSSGH